MKVNLLPSFTVATPPPTLDPDPPVLPVATHEDCEKTFSASVWLSVIIEPVSTMIPPELAQRRLVSHGHVQAAVSCATPCGDPCCTHHNRSPLGIFGQRKAVEIPV